MKARLPTRITADGIVVIIIRTETTLIVLTFTPNCFALSSPISISVKDFAISAKANNDTKIKADDT